MFKPGVLLKVRSQLPSYMAMGERGMHDMAEMQMEGPPNTLPMMAGQGPFGPIAMGGMFTVLKVRDKLVVGQDPGWYDNPPGTVAGPVGSPAAAVSSPAAASGHGSAPSGSVIYNCSMHPEVRQGQPGNCPHCGMKLTAQAPAPVTEPAGHSH